jgi:hypothetical protein
VRKQRLSELGGIFRFTLQVRRKQGVGVGGLGRFRGHGEGGRQKKAKKQEHVGVRKSLCKKDGGGARNGLVESGQK